MMLEFRVDKQTLTRRDNEKVAANSRNFVTCRFEISPEWFAVTPYIVLKAVFERDGEAYGVLLDSEHKCYLPHEVVACGGFFWVSLIGLCADDEGTPIRATSNRIVVRVEESGANETQNSAAPTPDELEQIEMKIAEFGNRPVCISSLNAMRELCVLPESEYYFIWIAPPAELGASGSLVLQTGAIYSVSRKNGEYTVLLTADLNGKDGAAGAPGADGRDGADGADGFSPTVTVTKSNGESLIRITDQSGVHTAKILDGVDGKDGANGKDGVDGKTPVKGEDYFTEEEKAVLVSDVLAALPTWEGGSY